MLSQADSVEPYIERMCAAEPERQAKAAAASGQHDVSSKSDEFYLELESIIDKRRTAADKSEEAATAAAAVTATARSLARSLVPARQLLRTPCARSCAHHALSPAPAHTPPCSELRSSLLGVCAEKSSSSHPPPRPQKRERSAELAARFQFNRNAALASSTASATGASAPKKRAPAKKRPDSAAKPLTALAELLQVDDKANDDRGLGDHDDGGFDDGECA